MKRIRSAIDEPALIAYYCRECDKVIKAKSKGGRRKYSFICPECEAECCYGTARSLIHYFRIKEHTDNGKALLEMQENKLKSLQEKSLEKDTTTE